MQAEVDRISEVDLEAHFIRHNKAFSDISGSINLVNNSIGGLVQNVQSNYKEVINVKNDLASTLKQIQSNQSEVENRITKLGTAIGSMQDELVRANKANTTKKVILIVIGVLAVLATVAVKFN